MDLSPKKFDECPAIKRVHITSKEIIANMSDGRQVSISINEFPRLLKATSEQKHHFELSPGGYGIHWPELDEDISVKAFLR